MADVVFLVVICGFFALAALLVKACDRIIGSGAEVASFDSPTGVTDGDTGPAPRQEVAA
jgi:hypothetical protein